jgi:hypothetical protein
MPVHIFEENAFEKLVEVEGEDYRRFRTREEFGTCSFDAFFEKWHSNFKNEKFKDYRPPFSITVKGNGAIYGLHGFNRYIVLNSGEITFLKPSADKIEEIIKKARKAGFRMFHEV